jgi:hypothetical protein
MGVPGATPFMPPGGTGDAAGEDGDCPRKADGSRIPAAIRLASVRRVLRVTALAEQACCFIRWHLGKLLQREDRASFDAV